jgi:hypothetical protein
VVNVSRKFGLLLLFTKKAGNNHAIGENWHNLVTLLVASSPPDEIRTYESSGWQLFNCHYPNHCTFKVRNKDETNFSIPFFVFRQFLDIQVRIGAMAQTLLPALHQRDADLERGVQIVTGI